RRTSHRAGKLRAGQAGPPGEPGQAQGHCRGVARVRDHRHGGHRRPDERRQDRPETAHHAADPGADACRRGGQAPPVTVPEAAQGIARTGVERPGSGSTFDIRPSTRRHRAVEWATLFVVARFAPIAFRKSTLDWSRAYVCAVINVTPDSFSDGGEHANVDSAVAFALRSIAAGADLVDIGGESTRPGARPVPAEEEIARVLPVIRGLV